MPERPEVELDLFRQGDLDAFEFLFREHQRSVYGWILRIVRDPAAAEDLTIETFWRIHRAHARFEPARAFEPWARRIATRAALDWLRARRTEQAAATTSIRTLPICPRDRRPIPASPPRFALEPRRLSPVYRPACASPLFFPLSRSSRTKRSPPLLASLSALLNCASFAPFDC